MSEQVADVLNIVVDHGGAFKTETPGNDRDVLGQTHWLKHLRAEHSRVSNFNPLVKLWVEAENFKRWFRVWVVGWLILQVLDADLLEEGLHDTKEVVKADSFVYNDTFDLMELSQVSGVKCLVSEHAINREVLHWLELLLLCLLEKHLRADCRRMRSQDVLHRFLSTPAGSVANRSWQTILVSASNSLFVLFGDAVAGYGVLAEEGVLQVTGGMALRLEKRVEVPE